MNARQQLRTSARWRSAPIPNAFGSKPGPDLGPVIRLPLELDWSWEHEPNDWPTVNDLDLAKLYRRVLEVGIAEHVETYVDPERLNDLWDEHPWTGAVAETWQPWIDQYRAGCA